MELLTSSQHAAGAVLSGRTMTEHRARKSSGDARVPPHNLDAEASALGAALLSSSAAEAVVSITEPADFYKPAHQHIAHVIARLMAEDDPHLDVVTVADQLRRDGLLEECGGSEFLLRLQNATPAISNAHRYARIVKDTAILRRLIGTAAEISELGYSAHDDPSAAIVRAGELLSRMGTADAATLSTLEVADIAALLAGNLQPEMPALLSRTDGGALLYPGKMHVFQAEPSSGKSWLACYAVAEVLALGGAAGYLDHEDTGNGILGRLRTLGVTDAVMAERFYYANPAGKFGPAERLHLTAVLDRMNFDLVVIDGVGESLSRNGLSEDKAEDVIRWTDLLPRWIARTGAAVLMLDHVAKDPEQRGRWARGSGAKLAAVDGASYQVKVRVPFSRHRPGRFDMVVAKDRPGGVGAIGETVATVHVTPHAAGELVTIKIDPHTTELTAPTDAWKPTVIMGKVWQALDGSTVPLTASALSSLVHSEPRLVKEAITRLISEGFVAETGKRPKTLRTVKPYTDAPPLAAPAWREEPPPELFEPEDYQPTDEDLAEIDRQRGFYQHPEF